MIDALEVERPQPALSAVQLLPRSSLWRRATSDAVTERIVPRADDVRRIAMQTLAELDGHSRPRRRAASGEGEIVPELRVELHVLQQAGSRQHADEPVAVHHEHLVDVALGHQRRATVLAIVRRSHGRQIVARQDLAIGVDSHSSVGTLRASLTETTP